MGFYSAAIFYFIKENEVMKYVPYQSEETLTSSRAFCHLCCLPVAFCFLCALITAAQVHHGGIWYEG